MKSASLLVALLFIAGCSTLEVPRPFSGPSGASRTFSAPIAKVRPAVVSTVAQLGMAMSSIETRGGNELLKARKAGGSVEVEFERLGPASTRIRVILTTGSSYDAAGSARFIEQAGKVLSSSS
jgi:hypothetical protein